jgi:hypothetical protein
MGQYNDDVEKILGYSSFRVSFIFTNEKIGVEMDDYQDFCDNYLAHYDYFNEPYNEPVEPSIYDYEDAHARQAIDLAYRCQRAMLIRLSHTGARC